MDSMCISARNNIATLPKNHVRPKSEIPDHNAHRALKDLVLKLGEFIEKYSHGANRVSPLPEEENVDLMTVSTSLACANAVGKWDELDTTSCGFSKDITSELLGEVTKKHLHGANGVSPLPEEENVDLNSNDSSSTMRVSTSLPKANIAGKCSKIRLKLRLPYGFFKDLHGANRVSPLPEEENGDLNSNDSSSTMRVSTSLPTANIAGKCSNLRLKLHFLKKNIFLRVREAFKKHSHGANRVSPLPEEENVDLMTVSTSLACANAVGKWHELDTTSCGFSKIPVEEEMALHPYEPPKIIDLSSRPLAGPSIFNCSGLSDSTIPSSSNSSYVWVLDSGAACHVCYSRAFFEPFVPTSNSFVTLPNGHTVPVGGTGSVRLCDDLTLQNVLFVPQFHCNVLSISALTQQLPYVVSFYSDHYVIEDRTQGRRIGMGRQVGNLYILDLSNMFFVSS